MKFPRRLSPPPGPSPSAIADHSEPGRALARAGVRTISGDYALSVPRDRPANARRHEAVQMPAIRPAPCFGRSLELDFDIDVAPDDGSSLELACAPSSHQERSTSSPKAPATPHVMQRTSSSQPRAPTPPASRPSGSVRRSSAKHVVVDAHAALVAFAGFGDPPSSVWQAPAYAVRVTLRRRVLIDGLRRARARGSRDAGVYEAALRTANDAVIRNGVLVVATMTALAGMLLFAAARVLSVLDIHL